MMRRSSPMPANMMMLAGYQYFGCLRRSLDRARRLWVKNGSCELSSASPLIHQQQTSRSCKNHDLCTNSLTHIKCGFMLCILYVRNGGRYDGLWIRAGKHPQSDFIPPISSTLMPETP